MSVIVFEDLVIIRLRGDFRLVGINHYFVALLQTARNFCLCSVTQTRDYGFRYNLLIVQDLDVTPAISVLFDGFIRE